MTRRLIEIEGDDALAEQLKREQYEARFEHEEGCDFRRCREMQPCDGHSLGACCPCTCVDVLRDRLAAMRMRMRMARRPKQLLLDATHTGTTITISPAFSASTWTRSTGSDGGA